MLKGVGFLFVCCLLSFGYVTAFHRPLVHRQTQKIFANSRSLKMIEFQGDTASYVGLFVATLVPSLLLIKFVGDAADDSRDKVSDRTKDKFRKAMMEQPGANFALPTSEEEAIKRQIAKAYMQDKDVDVAVLEKQLRERVEWRKEILKEKERKGVASVGAATDDEGW